MLDPRSTKRRRTQFRRRSHASGPDDLLNLAKQSQAQQDDHSSPESSESELSGGSFGDSQGAREISSKKSDNTGKTRSTPTATPTAGAKAGSVSSRSKAPPPSQDAQEVEGEESDSMGYNGQRGSSRGESSSPGSGPMDTEEGDDERTEGASTGTNGSAEGSDADEPTSDRALRSRKREREKEEGGGGHEDLPRQKRRARKTVARKSTVPPPAPAGDLRSQARKSTVPPPAPADPRFHARKSTRPANKSVPLPPATRPAAPIRRKTIAPVATAPGRSPVRARKTSVGRNPILSNRKSQKGKEPASANSGSYSHTGSSDDDDDDAVGAYDEVDEDDEDDEDDALVFNPKTREAEHKTGRPSIPVYLESELQKQLDEANLDRGVLQEQAARIPELNQQVKSTRRELATAVGLYNKCQRDWKEETDALWCLLQESYQRQEAMRQQFREERRKDEHSRNALNRTIDSLRAQLEKARRT